jgi:hypothetical protein
MSSIKNFGIAGVGGDVQFGKGGNRLLSSGGTFSLVDTSSNPVRLIVANAVSNGDAVALGQLSSVADALTGNISTVSSNVSALAASTTANAAALYDAIQSLNSTSTANAVDLASQIAATAANVALNTSAIALNAGNIDLANSAILDLQSNAVAQQTQIDSLLANTTASTGSLQTEVDAIETAVGLNPDGSFAGFTGTSYLDAVTTVRGALSALDGQILSVVNDAASNAVSQQALIDQNTKAISDEVTRATGVEAGLQTQINNEVARATDAESAIANSVLIETVRAQGAEQTIANSVVDETNRALAAESLISNAVTAETTRATGVEGGLRTDLDALSAKVTNLGNVFEYKGTLDGSTQSDLTAISAPEIGDYYKVTVGGTFTGADDFSIVLNANDGLVFNGTTWDKIDNTDSAVFGTTDYVDVTGSSDTGYTVNLASTFVQRLVAVEGKTGVDTSSLQSQIDAIIANATAESQRIDGVDAAQNEALAAEANARSSADTINAQTISDEVTRATAAEAALNSLISNVTIDYQAADLVLTNALADEVARAKAAEAALNSNVADVATSVTAETTRATAAEDAINANVAALATGLDANVAAEVSRATAAEGVISTLLANVVTAAGLNADGQYVANTGAHYIAGATNLEDADNKLDAALYAVSQGLASLSQDNIKSADGLYSVKTTDNDIEFFGDVGGVSTLFANAVTSAAQDSTMTFSTAIAGEIRLEAHSDIASNVDIRLVPQGTGQVVVGQTGSNGVIQSEDGYDLTVAGGDNTAGSTPGRLILRGGAAGTSDAAILLGGDSASTPAVGQFSHDATSITLAGVGTASNIDLVLAPKGTGSVSASGARITTVANATANTDAVNLGQLNAAVAAATSANDANTVAAQVGSIRAVTAVLTSTSATVNLGALVKGTVVRIKVQVTAAYAAGSQITVGDTSDAASLAASSDIDEAGVGFYVIEQNAAYGTATQLTATVSSAGAIGSALVVVEYIQG